GIAMPIKISSGMTVQRISTVRFSWNLAATAPLARRCMIIDQNITPNTMAPMITEIQKMVMCRLKTERLTSVAPGLMLMVQLALVWPARDARNKPISQLRACRNIPVSPCSFFYNDSRAWSAQSTGSIDTKTVKAIFRSVFFYRLVLPDEPSTRPGRLPAARGNGRSERGDRLGAESA